MDDRYLDVLEDVCNIESPTNYKDGVDAVGKYFIKMAEQRGWKVETLEHSVAEHCNFAVDIRFVNNKQLEQAKARVKEIAETTYIQGCTCELEEVSFRPAMPQSENNEQLLEKMNETYENNGLTVLAARKCLSGSDAAYITECDIPCVDCIGTEGSKIHFIDEFMRLDSLKESAKRIAAVAYCIIYSR